MSVDIALYQRDHNSESTPETVIQSSAVNGDPVVPLSKSSTPTSPTSNAATTVSPSSEHTTPVTTISPIHGEPRAPVPASLPNLAKEALERLKNKKESLEEEDDDDDFKPLKKRKVDENTENQSYEVKYPTMIFVGR